MLSTLLGWLVRGSFPLCDLCIDFTFRHPAEDSGRCPGHLITDNDNLDWGLNRSVFGWGEGKIQQKITGLRRRGLVCRGHVERGGRKRIPAQVIGEMPAHFVKDLVIRGASDLVARRSFSMLTSSRCLTQMSFYSKG